MGDHAVNITQAVLPQELKADQTHVILVGGSFDPVHIAHIQIAVEARATLPEPDWRASWLVFVPAGTSPFKVGPGPAGPSRTLAPTAAQRVELIQLAIRSVDRACVWTDEIDRASIHEVPSYTIDTVRRAIAARPGLHLRFMIGADQAASLHRWREARELIRLAQPLCVLRPPMTTISELRQSLDASGVWSPQEIAIVSQCAVQTSLLKISSTAIRAAIASGASARELPELDHLVAARIDELGLYRVVP